MGALIPQSVYAKTLRSHLPKAAFEPDPSKLYLLGINMLILVLGWGMGAQLHHWPTQWLWLYLPFALIMGNSVMVFAFGSHDLMHGSVIRNHKLASRLAVLTLAIVWMPPTLWKIIHNRVHHNRTNSVDDPDRNYFFQQPHTLGKWGHSMLCPSSEVALPQWILGLMTMWGLYAFRNILAALVWNGDAPALAPATFPVTSREKWAIVRELAIMAGLHLSILAWLAFNPLQIALAYLLPLVLGYAGMIAYIYTNHIVSPSTEVNDPLVNSLSLRMPKIFDILHVHFSYHAEHHIFPGLNSDYYPMVRAALQQEYGDRMGYLVGAREAWKMLLSTPRNYLTTTTLTDLTGQRQEQCHMICDLEAAELAEVSGR